MAYTLQQSPALWTPAYNPMVFIVDSSNNAQDNFKYIADIYISGTAGRVARLLCDADPTYVQGMFDIQRVVESYLSSDPGLKTLYSFQKASNSMIAYEVKFGEQYGVTSAVTTYPDIVVTGTKYAFNGAYTTEEFLTFDGSLIAIEDNGQLLNGMTTPQPQSYTSASCDRYFHYISNTSGTVYFAEIKTYDVNDALIQTVKIENTYQAVSAYDQRRMIFYAGARALNASTLYSGSQPVIDDTVKFYTVNFRDWFNNSPLYQIFRFNNDTNCYSGRVPLTLHWKNRYGGFDSFEFTMVNRYKSKTVKDSFRKKLGTMTNNAWSYNKHDAGKLVHSSRNQVVIELQSNHLSLADSYLIYDLIESQEVYLDDSSGIHRVNIISPTDGEIQSVSYGNIELNSVKIVIEFSQENWRQRG